MTPEQVRMARALLRITTRGLAKAAGVNKDTIVSIEAGKKGHAGPVARIKAYLESQGIFFIPALDTMHGPAVALRWGVVPPDENTDDEAAADAGEDDSLEAGSWNEGVPLAPKEIEGLRRYWRDGDRWERLSEPGRKALGRVIGWVALPNQQ